MYRTILTATLLFAASAVALPGSAVADDDPPPAHLTPITDLQSQPESVGRCAEIRKLRSQLEQLPTGVQKQFHSESSIPMSMSDPWGNSPSAHEQFFLSYRKLQWAVFENGVALTNRRLKPSLEQLRTAEAELLCLGEYRPLASCEIGSPTIKSVCKHKRLTLPDITAGELAARIKNRADNLQADIEEDARCNADPKCVKEREKNRTLESLCYHIQELKTVKDRLGQRKADARRYGVINATDQHDDIENKNDLVGIIKMEKQDYREVTGKSFRSADCK